MSDMLRIEFSYFPIINFAMQQNRVSFVRELIIENISDQILQHLKVELVAEPEFAQSIPYVIEQIESGAKTKVTMPLLHLSATYFGQLSERMAAGLTLSVSAQGGIIFSQIYPVDILAYDQWGGVDVLPEMVSAFITPNHPAIAPVVKRAATILEQWTGNASLDEYQSRNPDRVRKQMAAIYTAIAEQDIVYSTAPASFEEYGQRIRLVDSILQYKFGNCLDMTLFFCSCLESVGIHSIVVIAKGHAFAGAWLIPDTFPDRAIDDPSFITKRSADGMNEITLVEATCMNSGQNVNFDRAVQLANGKIADASNFILAIDVKRSRYSGIRPIPQRTVDGLAFQIDPESDSQEEPFVLPESVNPYDLSGIIPELNVTKQLLWERKLLDLSLRNNLLNIRMTKNTLQLLSPDLDLLEDALADGSEFRILHKPTDWDNPLYDNGLYRSISQSDPLVELVKSELTQKRLHAYLNENDLAKSLTYLYRSSRIALEENGANTLYITLGLLEWYETPNSERPRYAPILLLPVEIVRKSASKGYVIRGREEEAMMNITLLEMLRQNFGITINGLDPLPTDSSGVDVKLIFTIIRNSIRNQRKWDVREQTILGIFSFNKFIMWNDIHNNVRKLMDNKIVSSLVSGKIEWGITYEDADAAIMDKELSPADIVLPISADSSQLEAIYDASQGKSFILHGPPGTGKSQTITNIIANALYKGKRVLFVAEKMAALSVVQNRLESLGLAPFCLELYSNKAKKTSVLAQLRNATEVMKSQSPENFSQEANRLFSLRLEINAYIDALHRKQPSGLSLYDAITGYLSIIGKEIDIPVNLLQLVTKEKRQEWLHTIDLLVSVCQVCGHPYNHPLTGIDVPDFSSNLKNDAAKVLGETSHLLQLIKSKIQPFTQLLIDPSAQISKGQINSLCRIFQKILSIPELTPGLLSFPRLNEALDEFQSVIPHGEKREALRALILESFYENALSLPDAEAQLQSWRIASQKWFLPRFFGQNRIKKMLKPYHKLHRPDTGSVGQILQQIVDFQKEEMYIHAYVPNFFPLFGKYGKKGQEDWKVIREITIGTRELNALIVNYAPDFSAAASIKHYLCGQLGEGMDTFRAIYGSSFNEFILLVDSLTQKEELLRTKLGINIETLYGSVEAAETDGLDAAIFRLNRWFEHIDGLKDWCLWLNIHRKMVGLEIGFLAEKFRDENMGILQIKDVFTKSLCKALVFEILEREPHLELFQGKLFDDIISRYRQLTDRFEKLTRQELFARLASNIPDFTREATQNSEVGILQRNIRNNARGTSIRKLFDQIPVLLNRLCPCMLMSPISVAQYIDPDSEKFDLLIFDEASQMPTYEAIGAIARGANVVIVGDPKQMPPTNFFTTSNVDEDHIEIEDLESILDDCLALSMPQKHLLWHYRSKHESLIAFSNSEYYDNKLLTFPSPDNIDSKVRFISVEGYYDKGKSRQNEAEAKAVVAEIARRLRDPGLRQRSIGVVTFSSVQQSLVEDLLSDLFVFHPQLETLAMECEEPIFVKNLENVQGDERDVILFSVGYGPDKDGRVSMNFGPLNRLGGERRLNVAVSRARYEMLIFSTLRSDQIDLNRTNSVGVAGLKRFLEYAEKRGGERIAKKKNSADARDGIENLIADQLKELGYTVHTMVGCSGYRVDIAIVDKDSPSEYILGVLCDGENYISTKTTRDREIVQTNVLGLLGWNILRVWTLDWWENPSAVMDDILNAVNQLEKGENRTSKTARDAGVRSAIEVFKQGDQVLGTSADTNIQLVHYRPAALLPVGYSSDGFTHPENEQIVLTQIAEVIEAEAPISRSLLNKRVLSAWGIVRLGSKIDGHISKLLTRKGYFSTHSDGVAFLWQNREQYLEYDLFRIRSGRDSVDLPPEEVASAMKHILSNEISLPTADLARLTAQMFGFSRFGLHLEVIMKRGLVVATERNFLKVENGRAIYTWHEISVG
jgi:superfamily I DNA and/or RNA helicase/very-short-patch-repair endonuclease